MRWIINQLGALGGAGLSPIGPQLNQVTLSRVGKLPRRPSPVLVYVRPQ